MLFIILLAITTFCIAASAAFFSVFGMMQTYSAIAIPILIMGASLELGKLMTASVLYRMWSKLKSLRIYLILALAGLMLMTSLGIFGYLTAGYQKDSVPMEQINQKLDIDKQEITRLIDRKKEIDAQIAKLPNNFVSSRQKLMDSFAPELKNIGPRIEELQKEIGEYQTKKIDTEAHIGPIMYVAKIFGRSPDESVFWFTLLIMSVFDPLAVALTLATNMAIKHRREEQTKLAADTEQEKFDAKEWKGTALGDYQDDHPEETPMATLATPPLTPLPESLTKNDVVKIVGDAIANKDLDSLQKRKEILQELRK
jgi:hypothetical protein